MFADRPARPSPSAPRRRAAAAAHSSNWPLPRPAERGAVWPRPCLGAAACSAHSCRGQGGAGDEAHMPSPSPGRPWGTRTCQGASPGGARAPPRCRRGGGERPAPPLDPGRAGSGRALAATTTAKPRRVDPVGGSELCTVDRAGPRPPWGLLRGKRFARPFQPQCEAVDF